MFIFEILVGAVVPMIIFSMKNIREKISGVAAGAFMVVFGFVLNRINVSGVSTITLTGSSYTPSWMEISISLGVVSAACFAFIFFIENFSVYKNVLERKRDRFQSPIQDPISNVRLDYPWAGSIRRLSLVFIFAVALGFSLIKEDILYGAKPLKTPVKNPRLVEVIQTTKSDGTKTYEFPSSRRDGDVQSRDENMTKVLMIDGDRNGSFVLFNHYSHSQSLGGKTSCSKCHHINKPLEISTSCYECHGDMYLVTDIFHHGYHVKKMGENKSCKICHKENDQPKNKNSALGCSKCHKKMISKNSLVKNGKEIELDMAPSYKDAMHGLCITCHKEKIRENPQKYNENFARCKICHDPDYVEPKYDKENL